MVTTHGTTGYQAGCRCEVCKEARRSYMAEYRARKLASSDFTHGIVSGYQAGCRCEECRAAQRKYMTEYKAKKAATDSYRHGTNSGYVDGCRCGLCKAAQRAYMAEYKERLALSGAYKHGTVSGYVSGCRCDDCALAQRGYMMERNYGISVTYYDDLHARQGGKCAACDLKPDTANGFHIDHDHETGAVRALLCHGCNVSFGQMREDPARIEGLLKYARRWQ